MTPGELRDRAARLAGGLASLGTGRGDRVALLMPNRVEMVESLFACANLGAIQVPLNYWIRGEYLRYQLSDCGARVLIADQAGFETAEPLLAGTGIEHVVLLDGETQPGGVRYQELLASAPAEPVAVAPGDLMSISYTSGTTAVPKGCMLSHGYYTQIGRTYAERGWLIAGDREYTAFPLFHVSGQLLGIMSTLVNDASLAVAEEFHASTFVADAAALEATMLFGVGAMANALLNQPRQDTDAAHSLRLAIFAPLAPGRQLEFEDRFRTILFDHVGAGRSDLTAYDPQKYSTLDGYADDVVEIGHELGLTDAVFVGHSVSAMIGLLASLKAPGMFRSLVMIGPSPRYIDDGDYTGGFQQDQIAELLAFLAENHMGWSTAMAPMITEIMVEHKAIVIELPKAVIRLSLCRALS